MQEYLLNNAHIRAVYESAVERQFATADINTVITLICKGRPASDAGTRFVSLRGEFDTALDDPQLRREIVRGQAALRTGATAGNRFVGDKWGGKYLRAPDIYHAILNNYGDKLVRLGDVATVRFGIKTGANDFFYLTPERIAEFNIEPEYCRPVMTTPQESRSIAADPARLPKHLFLCHDDKDALAGTGALAYIEWGEAQGYHKNKSFASKALWWDIGPTNAVQLAINTLVDTTARTFYSPSEMLFDSDLFHSHNRLFIAVFVRRDELYIVPIDGESRRTGKFRRRVIADSHIRACQLAGSKPGAATGAEMVGVQRRRLGRAEPVGGASARRQHRVRRPGADGGRARGGHAGVAELVGNRQAAGA